jgi:hypothetical protein
VLPKFLGGDAEDPIEGQHPSQPWDDYFNYCIREKRAFHYHGSVRSNPWESAHLNIYDPAEIERKICSGELSEIIGESQGGRPRGRVSNSNGNIDEFGEKFVIHSLEISMMKIGRPEVKRTVVSDDRTTEGDMEEHDPDCSEGRPLKVRTGLISGYRGKCIGPLNVIMCE